MAGDLQFTWELVGVGGVTYRIADGASEHETHIGYCTDALADLLHAITGLYGDLHSPRTARRARPWAAAPVFAPLRPGRRPHA
ncbi:hypothetical protein [Streptomyces sp. NPDC012508]|uniref:hypothetical protein n=1 Tax=Streptomyces sp. NPDC012508 TaxID=3364837 RepID=UPI00367DD454